MNKAFGKKGLTLITALMAVVLVVSGRRVGREFRLQEGKLGFDRGSLYTECRDAGLALDKRRDNRAYVVRECGLVEYGFWQGRCN